MRSNYKRKLIHIKYLKETPFHLRQKITQKYITRVVRCQLQYHRNLWNIHFNKLVFIIRTLKKLYITPLAIRRLIIIMLKAISHLKIHTRLSLKGIYEIVLLQLLSTFGIKSNFLISTDLFYRKFVIFQRECVT